MITDTDITKLKTVFATKEDTDRRFDIMAENMSEMQSDISELKSDVSELKSDVSELKTDMSGMKTDVVSLKMSMSGLTSDMIEVKEKLNRLDDIYTLLDKHVTNTETNKMETAAAHHKLERHDVWIHHLAETTGTTLPA